MVLTRTLVNFSPWLRICSWLDQVRGKWMVSYVPLADNRDLAVCIYMYVYTCMCGSVHDCGCVVNGISSRQLLYCYYYYYYTCVCILMHVCICIMYLHLVCGVEGTRIALHTFQSNDFVYAACFPMVLQMLHLYAVERVLSELKPPIEANRRSEFSVDQSLRQWLSRLQKMSNAIESTLSLPSEHRLAKGAR